MWQIITFVLISWFIGFIFGAVRERVLNKNYSEEEILKLINLILSEIEIRKNNIISNKDKMTTDLLEGGCIAFESSQDVIKKQFKLFKK